MLQGSISLLWILVPPLRYLIHNSVCITMTELWIKRPLYSISAISLASQLFGCSPFPLLFNLWFLIFAFTCLLTNKIMTTESTCSYNIARKNGTKHSFIWMCSPVINYALKNHCEVAITLCLYLYSTHYTVLQTCKKLLCINSVNEGEKQGKP